MKNQKKENWKDTNHEKIASKEVSNNETNQLITSENPILSIRSLSKCYGDKRVVDELSFDVREGEILGLLGPNGAGKSTTIHMITGVENADGGEILYHDVSIKELRKSYLKDIGIVPQEIAVYMDLSAYDNVRYFCSLYGISGQELNDRTKEALEFVGLWEKRKEKPRKYSGGMKRRLNIACAIAHSPKLLIMDEPTVGIDPQSRNHIMEAIRKIKIRGTTVIYVSHYMEEIEALCEHIVVMDHGHLLEDMRLNDLKTKYDQLGLTSLEKIFLQLTGTQLRDEEDS